jgi:hypothetical protein
LKDETGQEKSLRVAKIAVFAALYAATSLIPISPFIGVPSFLALNVILTPVLAILLLPLDAFLTGAVGGVVALFAAPSQAMFGPLTIFLPVAGATFGSLAFHRGTVGGSAAALFLLMAISAYLIVNYSFPYFVFPHAFAAIIAGIPFLNRVGSINAKIPLYAFVSTMCEQGTMMIFSVYILGLPWQVFVGILPFMLYERAVGTIGGSLVVLALVKSFPEQFPLKLV